LKAEQIQESKKVKISFEIFEKILDGLEDDELEDFEIF
jgi:hypothetical protein